MKILVGQSGTGKTSYFESQVQPNTDVVVTHVDNDKELDKELRASTRTMFKPKITLINVWYVPKLNLNTYRNYNNVFLEMHSNFNAGDYGNMVVPFYTPTRQEKLDFIGSFDFLSKNNIPLSVLDYVVSWHDLVMLRDYKLYSTHKVVLSDEYWIKKLGFAYSRLKGRRIFKYFIELVQNSTK